MSFIDKINLQIGSHLGFNKQLLPTIEKAIDCDMGSLQFFLGNNKSFKRQRLTKEDIEKCIKLTNDYNIDVFSHYPYTSSLVGSVNSLAWNGDIEQDLKTTNIVKELEHELYTLSKVSTVNGVVIHPGSYKNTKDGLETIAKSINKINFPEKSKLLLENSAAEGTKIPKNFKELKTIFDAIDLTKRDNVGVCVDTAHIWGAGIYNLTKRDEIDKMFYEFDKYIGLDKFNLLHLNDSGVELGSRKDRHECVCDGKIWGEDNTSLIYLLRKCSEKSISVISETSNAEKDLYVINQFE